MGGDRTLGFCAMPANEIGKLQASTGKTQLRSIITKECKGIIHSSQDPKRVNWWQKATVVNRNVRVDKCR